MSAHSQPFGERHYELNRVRLHPLAPDRTAGLAQHLVQLDPWRTLGYTQTGLRGYLDREDPGLHRYAIEAGSELAGVCCVRYPWLLGPYLELLAIVRHYQGSGIGREIMTWLERQTTPVARNLWTVVSAFNTQARRFYARCGFVEVAELPGLIRMGYDEILLRKVLDGA